MSGKRFKKQKSKITLIFIITIILLLLISTGLYFLTYYENSKTNISKNIEKDVIQIQNIADIDKTELEVKNQELKIVDVDMPETMENYDILGELKIEKINLDLYILNKTNDESLNLSITKLWGTDINEIGNFNIIGHNYERLFKNLKKLENGDTFELIDKNGRYCKYEVFSINIVNPTDVECLDPSIDGIREATLITCTTGGKKRLIIKGKEIKEEI